MNKLLKIIFLFSFFSFIVLLDADLLSHQNKLILPSKKKNQISAKKLQLDLETILAIGITNNFQLKSIKSQKQVYDLEIMERWRDFFPSFSVSYSNTQSVAVRESDTRTQNILFESDFTIYDGGRKFLAYDVARLKRILARNDYRIYLNRLIMEMTSAYLEVIQLKGMIKIHDKTLDMGSIQLRLIKKELELGEATRFQVMEIEAKVKEIELNLAQAIDNFKTALYKFKLILRIDWRQPIDVIGNLDKDVLLKPVKTDINEFQLVSMAFKNRKEIQSSVVEFDINKKTHALNQLYFMPRFSAGFTYGFSGETFPPRKKEWSANLKVTSILYGNSVEGGLTYEDQQNSNTKTVKGNAKVNILDRLSYKREIVQSKIKKQTSEETKNDVKQQIAVEVSTSLKTLISYWEMIKISQRQLELYDSQLKIERLKANMGDSTRYDLMEKEIERGKAAISYLESKVRYLSSGSTLELALGVDIGYLKISKIKVRLRNGIQ